MTKIHLRFLIIILFFVKNCPRYDTIHEFSVWLRTGYYPGAMNRFGSHTGKYFKYSYLNVVAYYQISCPSQFSEQVYLQAELVQLGSVQLGLPAGLLPKPT